MPSTKSSFGYQPEYIGVTPGGLAPSSAKPVAVTVSVIAEAGDQQYTAAQIMGGMVEHDPSGGAVAAKMPTAAELMAAFNGPVVGSSKDFILKNTADAAEAITITSADAKLVLTSGDTWTIAQNKLRKVRFYVSASDEITAVSLGEDVF